MVYQTILPGAHVSLTGVSILHLDCSAPAVPPLLLPFSFLGGLLPLLVSGSNFFALGPHDLESFSAFQKGSLFL